MAHYIDDMLAVTESHDLHSCLRELEERSDIPSAIILINGDKFLFLGTYSNRDGDYCVQMYPYIRVWDFEIKNRFDHLDGLEGSIDNLRERIKKEGLSLDISGDTILLKWKTPFYLLWQRVTVGKIIVPILQPGEGATPGWGHIEEISDYIE